MDRKITEADLDEVIFWEGMMRECEDEEYATDCYRSGPDLKFESEPEPQPDQVLEATLTKDVIAKVLQSLPLYYRELLKLRYFEDIPLEEIGIRFWTQLGLEESKNVHYMTLLETESLLFARMELYEMGIMGSKDLLPS